MRQFLNSALLLIFTLCALSVRAADSTAAFDAANRLYEQGRFREAAAAYEGILKTGQSPALFFNLGNAYYKSGQLGQALAAYRRAENLAPRDPDVRANLQFVRTRIQGPKEDRSAWEAWLRRLTLNEWAVLAAVPFWTCLLLLTAMQFRRNLRNSLTTPAWISGAAAAVLAILTALAWQAHTSASAVVTARDAVVRNGPLEESPAAFNVHDGAEVDLLDQKNDWVQVRAGGRIGWIRQSHVAIISSGAS